MNTARHTRGCLCGAVRYEIIGKSTGMGYCCCGDCRKASGSGFIPFMNFPKEAVRFHGETQRSVSKSVRGSDAVRNFCPTCHSLVFGGEVGKHDSFTIYAGSLDDPSLFQPTIAIFNRDRPAWVALPAGLTVFETMPGLG